MATVIASPSTATGVRTGNRFFLAMALLALAACSAPSPPAAPAPATAAPDLTGMYSDPPSTALDMFCFFACTDVGLRRLSALLDDPANDARPYGELSADAAQHQLDEYLLPRLTDAARAAPMPDPMQDPGFLKCEPWGFARQTFAPHQLEITQYPDRVDLHYGEWDQHRIVHLRDAVRPTEHTPMGYSVGHYEGDTLVVETTLVTANFGPTRIWEGLHSDQLTAVERYRRPKPEQLELKATLTDPVTFREPLELKKLWRSAPEQEIAAYNCEPAAVTAAEGKTP